MYVQAAHQVPATSLFKTLLIRRYIAIPYLHKTSIVTATPSKGFASRFACGGSPETYLPQSEQPSFAPSKLRLVSMSVYLLGKGRHVELSTGGYSDGEWRPLLLFFGYWMKDPALPVDMKQKSMHLIACCLQAPPRHDGELAWAKDVLRKMDVSRTGNLEAYAVVHKQDLKAMWDGIRWSVLPPMPGVLQEGEFTPKLESGCSPAVLMCTTNKIAVNVLAFAANRDSVTRSMYIIASVVHTIADEDTGVPASLLPVRKMLKAVIDKQTYISGFDEPPPDQMPRGNTTIIEC